MCCADRVNSSSTSSKAAATTILSPTAAKHEELIVSPWKSTIAAFILSPLTAAFASWFPFVIPYTKASQYYMTARYEYEEGLTYFDNSAWTYMTDYLLAMFMAYASYDMYQLAKRCATIGPDQNQRIRYLNSLCLATCGLLAFYATSVLCGGISHQFFTTLDSLNTLSFRFMWIMTVGTVTAASGFIGAIGSFLALYFYDSRRILFQLPIKPTSFWFLFATYLTVVCILGEMSFHRPACDIFVAGCAQFTPTAYVAVALLSRNFGDSEDVAKEAQGVKFDAITVNLRALFIVAFFLNAPLLPIYPELLDTGIEEGYLNTLLHTNLCVAWGLQYVAIKKICVSQLPSAKEDKRK